MPEQFIQAYHRSTGDNLPIIRLVLHATCPGLAHPKASAAGEAVATAHYFEQPSSGGSAHHVTDVTTSVRCATDATICWHAPPNPHSLGYEIGGEVSYTREEWLSPKVWPAVQRAAAEMKADAAKHGIPIRRLTVAQVANNEKGICGHVDVSQAFHQSDHTDPGPHFPWDAFMALLVTVTPHTSAQPAHPAAPRPPDWYHRPLRFIPGQPLMHGADVTHVQQRLIALHLLPAHNAQGHANADGLYGNGTAAAVERLQRSKHLKPDGVTGPDSARAIG